MEFTFFDFDLHESGLKVTPYLYTGLSIASHDNYYFDSDDVYTMRKHLQLGLWDSDGVGV